MLLGTLICQEQLCYQQYSAKHMRFARIAGFLET